MAETKNSQTTKSKMEWNLSKQEEDESFANAVWFINSVFNVPVLKAAVDLGVLDMLNQCGPGEGMSASEIASRLPTSNPEAANMISCLLNLLLSQSFLTVTRNGDGETVDPLYGLAPASKFFVPDQDGVSMAASCSLEIINALFNSALHLKDAIIEGGSPFVKHHGMQLFEYGAKHPTYQESFDKAMSMYSYIVLREVLNNYKGFEGISTLVDVGGGNGASLVMILSQYPHLKGINFDQPHVIAKAPICPGIEHIGGDLFDTIPKGDAIFLKYICHCFNDEACIKFLKNCYNALPKDHGKVVVCECLLPEVVESSDNIVSKSVVTMNMAMMLVLGGKERTKQEFKALAFAAGFQGFQVVCSVHNVHVMELLKETQS